MPKTCAAFLALLSLALSAQAQDRAQERHLTMTGSARVEAQPDITRARGGLYVEGDSAVDAMKQADRRMSVLTDAMRPFGTVEVAPVALGQSRAKGSRLIGSGDAGFTARSTVTVTLTDPVMAGAALDAFVGAGVEGVAYLAYDVSDRAPLVRQVREEAVADAVERARTYAAAADLTLGPIVSLSETTLQSGPRDGPGSHGARSSYGARGATGPDIVAVAATVTIRWALE